MSCEKYKRTILETNDKSKLPDDVRVHMETCTSCRNLWNTWAAVKDVSRIFAPSEVNDAIIIREAERYIINKIEIRKSFIRWFPFAAAAACIVLVSWLYLRKIASNVPPNTKTRSEHIVNFKPTAKQIIPFASTYVSENPKKNLYDSTSSTNLYTWDGDNLDTDIFELEIAIELDKIPRKGQQQNTQQKQNDIHSLDIILDYLSADEDTFS